jgi:serine/threonine-protein kinase
MTPDHHERIKAIFLKAIAAPIAERSRLIAVACQGDERLCSEVEILMAHHHGTGPSALAGAEADTVATDPAIASPLEAQATEISRTQPQQIHETLHAGTMIGDRYRVIAPLGRGGMGVVYRAEDLKLSQDVALKFLNPTLARNPVWVARLREEVRIARSVTHPSVCRVYDIGETEELHFLTMEFVEGEDLASLLRRLGPLHRDKAFQLGRQICFGLHAAHRAGVVHRDLKPGNILIDRDGGAHITDFGLAYLPGQGRNELRGGTPAYMAPEQLTGAPVTVRADIYALGLVLFELLAGQPAITAESVSQLLDPRRRPTPRSIGSLVKELPPGLEAVIERCLSTDPSLRPATALLVAAELPGADVLEAALEGGETPPPDLIAAAKPQSISGPWRTALAAMTVVLAAMLVYFKGTSNLPWDHMGSHPPSVLNDRSERLLTSLLGHDPPPHRAFGFCDADDLNTLASESFDQPEAVRFDSSLGPFFWFRAAPSRLAPLTYDNVVLLGDRTLANDPPAVPGAQLLAYDRNGLLIFYRANPAIGTELHREESAWNARELELLLTAADLTSDPSTAIGSAQVSDISVPVRMGESQQLADMRLRASHGRIVAFAVVRPRERIELGSSTSALRRERLTTITMWLMFLGLMVVAVPWAWYSYRSGYSDHVSALRLAITIFGISLFVRVLRFPTGVDFADALVRLAVGSFHAAGAGGLLAAFYLALDRYARKYWPDKLVTWTRLMNLRWRDPAVREHVLAGVGLGVFWGLLVVVERQLVASLGRSVRGHVMPERITERLMGMRPLLAGVLDLVPQAVLYGLLFMLVLVVARRLFVSRAWAATLAMLVLVAVLVPRGAHPSTSWAVWGLGGAALCVWAMMRFGLLTLVVGLFVAMVLNTTPMTLDWTSWQAEPMLFVLALIASGVLYGVWQARTAAPTAHMRSS